MTDDAASPPRGWVLYDGDCVFCSGLARRFERLLGRRGFSLVPLQTPWVRERLQLAAGAPLTEMRLLHPDGSSPGGADALVGIAQHIWWGWPFFLLARLGAINWLRRGYRFVAARRNCSKGLCFASKAPSPTNLVCVCLVAVFALAVWKGGRL
jgi:predicted DCC family thiol-disulfide oxidoreductase YuxK